MGALAMVQAERNDLAELLAELTPDQWNHHTLCGPSVDRGNMADPVGVNTSLFANGKGF
jgi:hypothetical protein